MQWRVIETDEGYEVQVSVEADVWRTVAIRQGEQSALAALAAYRELTGMGLNIFNGKDVLNG